MKILGVRSVRTSLLALFVASSPAAFGQSGSVSAPPADQNPQVSQSKPAMSIKEEPDDLKQELDADAVALSKIPADPLLQSDPFASVFQMETIEVGWFSDSPGSQYRDYRMAIWRDDTKTLGSGYGGGFAFEHEFPNGWAPFGRYAFASDKGTAIKQTDTIGLAQVHPFRRQGDMFGVAFNPTHTGIHRESGFESFYRLRLTESMALGPDIEVSIHPTYAAKAYTPTLVGIRMEIIL